MEQQSDSQKAQDIYENSELVSEVKAKMNDTKTIRLTAPGGQQFVIMPDKIVIQGQSGVVGIDSNGKITLDTPLKLSVQAGKNINVNASNVTIDSQKSIKLSSSYTRQKDGESESENKPKGIHIEQKGIVLKGKTASLY